MIGHWLLALTREQQDLILTRNMAPYHYVHSGGVGCLVGTASGAAMASVFDSVCDVTACEDWSMRVPRTEAPAGSRLPSRFCYVNGTTYHPSDSIEWRYDRLCGRYGTERVNGWIRTRILAIRAAQTLGYKQSYMTA